jgi:hypothetical protein
MQRGESLTLSFSGNFFLHHCSARDVKWTGWPTDLSAKEYIFVLARVKVMSGVSSSESWAVLSFTEVRDWFITQLFSLFAVSAAENILSAIFKLEWWRRISTELRRHIPFFSLSSFVLSGGLVFLTSLPQVIWGAIALFQTKIYRFSNLHTNAEYTARITCPLNAFLSTALHFCRRNPPFVLRWLN